MPTGYTADVASGKTTSLRDFALTCARGMGALVMMRDEPFNAPIPERFEPSDFYKKNLEEAKRELADLRAMTAEAADDAAAAEFLADLGKRSACIAENDEQAARYDAMIAKVEAWVGAPEGLKEFMLEQLRQSKKFDCWTPEELDRFYPAPERKSGPDWKHKREVELLDRIKRYAGEWEAEVARTEGRNAWIKQLRAALSAANGSGE